MNFIYNIFKEVWHIYLDVSIFMLFGFFVAGLLYVFFKADKIKKYLGTGKVKPVFLSALFGIPIPLWSCGVIPVVTGLKKQGANNGAALSFMIATPESGVDSIAVSWAMLDPVMTIVRPIAGFITAVSTGITENYFNQKKEPVDIEQQACQIKSNKPVTINTGSTWGCSTPTDTVVSNTDKTLLSRLADGMKYAFGDLLSDIARPFVIGIFIAGIISFFFPEDITVWANEHQFLSMLVMLGAGIPMYVCATSSTPIAAALILQGLNPGAALVFLLAGPATNVATINVVKKIFNFRTLIIYLSMITICSLSMGFFVDWLYMFLDIEAKAVVGQASEIIPYGLQLTSAIILAYLMMLSWIKKPQEQISLVAADKNQERRTSAS